MARRNKFRKETKNQDKKTPKVGMLDKLIDTFKGLDNSVQTVIIIGLLLLVYWLLAHPQILIDLINAFLGVISLRSAIKEL